VKWLTGYPEQADVLNKEALAWALETKHTSSIGLAYFYRMAVLHWNEDREHLFEVASVGTELMRQQGLPLHGAYCQIFKGWAARELESARQGLNLFLSAGLEIGKTHYMSLLAELELEAGRYDSALQITEELVSWGRATNEGYMIPALLRLQALCLRGKGEREAAEACLRQALGAAREQGARMWELKAASTLGELLRERGQSAEARELLAPLVRWFSEGLETPALVRAQALLRELS